MRDTKDRPLKYTDKLGTRSFYVSVVVIVANERGLHWNAEEFCCCYLTHKKGCNFAYDIVVGEAVPTDGQFRGSSNKTVIPLREGESDPEGKLRGINPNSDHIRVSMRDEYDVNTLVHEFAHDISKDHAQVVLAGNEISREAGLPLVDSYWDDATRKWVKDFDHTAESGLHDNSDRYNCGAVVPNPDCCQPGNGQSSP